MNKKKKQIILLLILIILLFIINCPWIDNFLIKNFENINKEDFIVKRIIDGDTIVVGEDLRVRLLGINCPEKGEKYYQEAKEFLEMIILNKTIFIEFFEKDLYYRELGFVFLDGKNVNLELVGEGLANVYVLDNKLYEKELRDVWSECIKKEKNLCEKSENKCVNCIKLKKFDYKNQKVILYNKCEFDCNLNEWTIKDEGRKKFVFQDFVLNKNKEIKIIVGEGIDSENVLFWGGEDYVWTKTGDTLFLRDKENKLVLWESY